MSYELTYTPRAQRAIERLPREIQKRIFRSIEALASNPRPPGSVKLTGEEAYRIRVGDYRVIYTIYDDRLLVLIIDIGHRREIYRR